jgi:hypothetical protein
MAVIGINSPWFASWPNGQAVAQYDELAPTIIRDAQHVRATWDYAASKGRFMLAHFETPDLSAMSWMLTHKAFSGVVELSNEPFWNGISPESWVSSWGGVIDTWASRVKLLAPIDDWPDAHNASGGTADWTKRLFTAKPDLKTKIYGYAVHPYGDAGVSTSVSHTQNCVAALKANGVSSPRLWATELGLSSAISTEQAQADYTSGLLSQVAPLYEAIFLYQNNDNPGNAVVRERGFGLYAVVNGSWDNVWRKKPAYAPYKSACAASPSGNFLEVVQPADTTPPDTSIAVSQSTPQSTSVGVSLTSTEANSTFEYRLDGGAWTSTPASFSLSLAVGSHTIDARAKDQAGNVDPSPSSVSVTVSAPTNNQSVTYTLPAPQLTGQAQTVQPPAITPPSITVPAETLTGSTTSLVLQRDSTGVALLVNGSQVAHLDV